MHLLQLRNAHVCIDLRGRKIRVAEKRLDEADVGAVLKHVGSAGVPEKVTSSPRWNASPQDEFLDQIPEAVFQERLAKVREEQRGLVQAPDQCGPGLHQVSPDPFGRASANGNDSIAIALSTPDDYCVLVEVQVVNADARQLHPANAGGVQHLEDCAITDAGGPASIGDCEDSTDFGNRWNPSRQSARDPGYAQIGGGVEGNVARPGKPLAERLQRVQARDLRIQRERQPVPLPATGQIALVTFQYLPRELSRSHYSVFVAPPDEVIQGKSTNDHCLLSQTDCPGP